MEHKNISIFLQKACSASTPRPLVRQILENEMAFKFKIP